MVDVRRIGIFGGTFDPIHTGHLGAAEAVKIALHLDVVLFVPAARPRLRGSSPRAAIQHRIEMTALAIRDLPWAELSMVDAVRPGPAYSVDTIADIRRDSGRDASLYLIVGADALRSLPEWKDPDRIATLATLVCVGRPGEIQPEGLPEGHPGRSAQYVEGPMVGVAATDVRARLAAGDPLAEVVPAAVRRYIELHCLYRDGDGA